MNEFERDKKLAAEAKKIKGSRGIDYGALSVDALNRAKLDPDIETYIKETKDGINNQNQ